MTRIKLSLAQTAVLIGIVVLAMGLGVQPAHAAVSCPSNSLCIYDTDTPGPDPYRYVINDDYHVLPCFNLPADWDNNAEGYWNKTSYAVTFFTGNSCQSGGELDPSNILPDTAWHRFDRYSEDEANSVLFRGGGTPGCRVIVPSVPCRKGLTR